MRSFGLARPCEVGAFSCFGVEVTAADRAAATIAARGRRNPSARFVGTSPFRGGFAWRHAPKGYLRRRRIPPYSLAFILVVSPSSPPPSADGDGLLFANEGENSSTSINPYADSRKADGTYHRLSCYPVSPNAACPRRLCQPPWTQPSLSEKNRTLRRDQLCRKAQAKRQPLFGREGSGGRGASLREAASPPSVPPTPRL